MQCTPTSDIDEYMFLVNTYWLFQSFYFLQLLMVIALFKPSFQVFRFLDFEVVFLLKGSVPLKINNMKWFLIKILWNTVHTPILISRDFIELYNIYKHKEDMCMFQ